MGALSPIVAEIAAADVFRRASTVCGVIMADSRVPAASRAAEKWGGITTEMKLYEREHRRYILRRMVYELFGVGGEDGGRPISAAAAAKPVSEEDARSGAETTVGGMGSR